MLEHFLQDHLPPLADSHWVAWYTWGKLNNMRGTSSKFRCVSQGLKMLLKTNKLGCVFCGSEDWSKVYTLLHLMIQLFWLNYALNYFYKGKILSNMRGFGGFEVGEASTFTYSVTVLLACLTRIPLTHAKPSGLFWLFYTTFHSTE